MTWLVLIILLLLIPEILSTVLDSRLARAFAERLEAGGGGRPDPMEIDRLHYLESEVERLSEQVRRLSEESEFLHDLLSERSAGPGSRLPPGEGDG